MASTRYGFKQVVYADRAFGGLGGFGIDALVVEIAKVWGLDNGLVARQGNCDMSVPTGQVPNWGPG